MTLLEDLNFGPVSEKKGPVETVFDTDLSAW